MNRPNTANGSVALPPRRAAERRTTRRFARPRSKTSPASIITPRGHPMTRTHARGSSPLRGSSPHARVSKLPTPRQPDQPDTDQHLGNYLATSGDSCWPLTAVAALAAASATATTRPARHHGLAPRARRNVLMPSRTISAPLDRLTPSRPATAPADDARAPIAPVAPRQGKSRCSIHRSGAVQALTSPASVSCRAYPNTEHRPTLERPSLTSRRRRRGASRARERSCRRRPGVPGHRPHPCS
jgi:hypothetical protein